MHILGKELQRNELFKLNRSARPGVIYFITLTLCHEEIWEQQQTLALLREDQESDELGRKVVHNGDKWLWMGTKHLHPTPETGGNSWRELLQHQQGLLQQGHLG